MRPGLMTCSVLWRSGGVREYLAGLLAPRERNKTLTALAGAEPVSGAQHPAGQRLQFFLGARLGLPARMAAVQQESTATGADADGLAGTREDGDLRVWTRVDVLPPDGMQEVSGSSPLSSTGQKRNSN